MVGNAAAAALVSLEWGLLVGRQMVVGTCPICGALEALGQHGSRCTLDAGLVELGFPTQGDRDELRAKLDRSEEPTKTDLQALPDSGSEDQNA